MKTNKSMGLRFLQLSVLIFITSVSSAQIKAGFTATPVTGCPPMVVSFKDISTGNPTSWKWDLGNGTTSFLQNPIATYFNSGNYTIKLLVTNATGKDSTIMNEHIVVKAIPVPDFSASETAGCFPLKVQFSDISAAGSGTIVKWEWDFGDGTLSNSQNPVHIYTSPGNFNVTLRTTNSNNCVTPVSKPAFIKIKDGVTAEFSYNSGDGCYTPAAINFTNKTTGTGNIDYHWDFGNGNTSTNVNPTNNYNDGVYSVILIATNSVGCSDTMVKSNAINIGAVNADFSVPAKFCEGSPIQLTNTSTPTTFTGATWNFDLVTSPDDNSGGSSPGVHFTSNEINPHISFPTAGVYKIKLVSDFGSCKDSIEKSVTVLPKPVVAFTATNNTSCSAPLNVTFKGVSADATSFEWTFGDNSGSILQNPEHSYASPGSYPVSLTVQNANGCANTIRKDSMVLIVPFNIVAITGLGVKGCIPISISPAAVLSITVPVKTYKWDFGDGQFSTLAAPTHTYTVPGIYNVKLDIVTEDGCTDTFVFEQAVSAGSKPVSKFPAGTKEVCASETVTFTDLSTGGPIDQWEWFFGDGTISSQQNPSHTYNDTGYFNVTLVTSSFGCTDTSRVNEVIHIRPPLALFDLTFNCNDKLTRSFNSQSIGATSWVWKFGDGQTSNEENPSHKYAAAGGYPVSLTVSNGDCEHTATREVFAIDEQGILTLSDSIICTGVRVIFKVGNVKAENIARYSWYFDSLQGNVIHTGNNPVGYDMTGAGIRHPAVILTDLLNCSDTIYTKVPLTIHGPVANFGSIDPTLCFGTHISFADSTITDGLHPIKEYLWDFGDGAPQSYSSGPFSHDYPELGDYTVKLVVTDNYGCVDSITKTDFVSLTKPVAKFAPSDSILCPAVPITFTNASVGVGTTYTWMYGDGRTSEDVSPVYTYSQPGTYKASMVMVDKNGCSDSASTTINIYAAKADFLLSDTFSTCPPTIVSITNQSANYIEHNWDFGDGGNSQLINPSHTYSYPGNYTVKLLVKNNGGCFDTLTKKVVIEGPTGTFDYKPKEVCNPGKVDYLITTQSNTVGYIWDFNDGTTILSADSKVSHTYNNPGNYLPKVILNDGKGCHVPVPGRDTVKVYSITTHISSDTRLVCDSGIVSFKDSSISGDRLADFLWNFGDGETSTLQNPIHHFADTGFYTISLKTTTRIGCIDSSTTKNYIKVVNAPLIKISGDTAACEPGKIALSAAFVKADTSAVAWSWDFGNGVSSNQQTPDSQSYVSTGTYKITLKATNSDGCNQALTTQAVIHPKPDVDAGPNATICRFTTHPMNATGAEIYTWTPSGLSCNNCANPAAKPDSTITYYVAGKTSFGCINTDSVTINVQQPFKMVVEKADTICIGESVNLNASGATAYEWRPSIWLSRSDSSITVSKPDSSITYEVIGKDDYGCFSDTQNVRITVYPIPKINITNGDNVNVLVGSTIKLTTKTSADVTSWKWFPQQWLSCGSCAETIAAPADKITYNVTATNEGNCTARDKITLNLICNDANVYMPNTFSPNGDGSNDIFYPRGSGLFDVLTFKVFNRWGQVVFQKNGISANDPAGGWDGTLNGSPLQPDVYVYLVEVVCSNKSIFPYKGNVSLIR